MKGKQLETPISHLKSGARRNILKPASAAAAVMELTCPNQKMAYQQGIRCLLEREAGAYFVCFQRNSRECKRNRRGVLCGFSDGRLHDARGSYTFSCRRAACGVRIGVQGLVFGIVLCMPTSSFLHVRAACTSSAAVVGGDDPSKANLKPLRWTSSTP